MRYFNLSVRIFIVLLCFMMLTWQAYARPSFEVWLQNFKLEAIADGIDPEFFDEIFQDVKLQRRVISFDRRQPEHRLTFYKYRSTRVDAYRIKLGIRAYKKYQQTLEDIGNKFGVDPCFIVSLWGMESSYGRYMGNFPVIDSLATLAYDPRRGKFFRKELLHALHILQGGHVTLDKFKGEWAGGSGHPQFLPSSWHRYAYDYNGDGKKDIWSTKSDVFASIANYLAGNGWERGQPWGIIALAPASIPDDIMTLKKTQSLREWAKMGVKPKSGNWPDMHLQASLIKPYGGPYFLAFKNFRVIMTYNRSIFYAGSIGYMADKICHRNPG